MKIVLLCGGLGGARLAPYLASRHQLTAICNVADDLEFMGLHVSPDLDAVLYSLAGCFDDERGFGVRHDTDFFMTMVRRSGADAWFWVGDRDLSTHVVRTAFLKEGRPLSDAISAIARSLGVEARVLPATDDRVRTRVRAGGGEASFHDFYVRAEARLSLDGVRWEGIEEATPAPGVLEALEEADLVLIAESNPVSSILPILGIGSIREALTTVPALCVAISPVVSAVRPRRQVDRHHWRARERLLGALGLGHDPVSVARLYRDLIDAFILDRRDQSMARELTALGVAAFVVDLLDRSIAARTRLVELLEALVSGELEWPAQRGQGAGSAPAAASGGVA